MVYPDFSNNENGLNANGSAPVKVFQASVLDRLFSFLLDYLILSPVVSFLILLFFKKEISVWKQNAYSAELNPTFFLLISAYLVFFSALQSVFAYHWQATPGQYFLKLKLEDQKKTGLLFFRIFFRQIGFWLSILFLGFPWLGVLSHAEQKTFYDKLAEFRVVSLKSDQVYFSFEFESKYWQALSATFMVFGAFLLTAAGWQLHDKIKTATYSFDKLNKQNYFCEGLKSTPLRERLQTVIALNLVGQIADECVDKEADFVLWKSDNTELRSLAYYAKSLTESDYDTEEKYLSQACKGQNKDFLGCKISNAFLKSDMPSLYELLNKTDVSKNLLSSTLRYELSVVLDLPDDQIKNFEAIKKFDSQTLVKKYLLSEILNTVTAQKERQRSPASNSDEQHIQSTENLAYAKKILLEM